MTNKTASEPPLGGRDAPSESQSALPPPCPLLILLGNLTAALPLWLEAKVVPGMGGKSAEFRHRMSKALAHRAKAMLLAKGTRLMLLPLSVFRIHLSTHPKLPRYEQGD